MRSVPVLLLVVTACGARAELDGVAASPSCVSFCADSTHVRSTGELVSACLDFDESTDVDSPSYREFAGGHAEGIADRDGTLSIDSTRAVSCTQAITATTPMVSGAGAVGAELTFVFDLEHANTGGSIEADVFVQQPQNGLFQLFGLDTVWVTSDATGFSIAGYGFEHPVDPPIAVNRWNHMRLGVRTDNGSAQISLDYVADDGTDRTTTFEEPLALGTTEAFAAFGLIAVAPTKATTVSYDNVVLRLF